MNKAMEMLSDLKELLRDEGEDPKAWIMEHLGGSSQASEEGEDEASADDAQEDAAEAVAGDEGAEEDKGAKVAMAIAAMKRKMGK